MTRFSVLILLCATVIRGEEFLSNSIETLPSISNYAPVLQVSSTEGYLSESSEIGTTVRISPNTQSESLQILVNDDDLKPGMSPATYQYILTGLGATIFAVDQRGFVYLNVPNIDADPPNPSTYQLNVQAREVDTSPVRSSEPVSITIHIMDDNDNSPQFEHPIYTANVSATGDERPIVMVLATDVDSGVYGQLTYRIAQVTNGAQDSFYYDENSHMLFALTDLIPGERYQVVIEASDGGGRTSRAIVVVLATDPMVPIPSLAPLPGMETFRPNPVAMGAFPPQAFKPNPSTISTTPMLPPSSIEEEETIQTFVTEVTENTPPNTVVVTLGGENPSDQLYYNIVGGNEEGMFAINPQTGSITTNEEFDRERTAMFSLQVETRSRQPDQHLYWTLVQISVLDINDNSPHFVGPQPIRISKSIDELDELSPNMNIGRVEVEDLDADDNGRLELRLLNNRLFKISNDGMVSINGDFTAAHFGEHKLIVTARDHGDPPRETRGEVVVSIFGTLITMATAKPQNEVFEYTTSEEESPDNTLPTVSPAFGSFPTPSENQMPVFPTVKLPDNEWSSEDVMTSEELQSTRTFTPTSLEPSPPSPRPSPPPPTARPSPTTTTRITFPPTTTTTTWATFPTTRTTSTTTTTTTTTPPEKRLAPVFNPDQITVTVEENKSEVEVAKVFAMYPDAHPGQITYTLLKGDPSLFAVSSFSGSVTLLRPLDAETDTAYTIQISTVEAGTLRLDPNMAHSATLTIHVGDVNDWIPAFEIGNEQFSVPEDIMPGSIVGQVSAFDQDRDVPNNRVEYRLISAGGLENHFQVNPQNGIITLARPINEFAGEKITLRIAAEDGGTQPQSSQTSVVIDVIQTSAHVIPEGGGGNGTPKEGTLQFSLRNYTTSVSEAVRPPHLVQVLSVNNKPQDTRFVFCNIVSGNYRGAFGVVAGQDGNCELRTQMELDRESVERYLLNITVTAGSDTDFALVSVTVLDVNDNVPRFVYDNDMGLSSYFAGVSSTAGAFTRILSVKAEDADLGNSSVVHYALDPLSVHSKYFSISPFGEISTKQSMSQVLQKSRLTSFEIRVSACDSPISGQQLCAKADVFINVITEAHRFRMLTSGLNPQQLSTHQKDMVKSLRQFTGACSMINIEKMVELTSSDNQARTDVYWYAVNPSTKKICKKQEFRKLFESSSIAMVAGKVQPWFRLDRISEDVGENESGGVLPSNWKTASIMLIGLAIAVAIGAILALFALCYFWSRYKVSQRNIHSFQSHPGGGYHNKMLEMPISDEETMKTNSMGGMPHRLQGQAHNYRNYGRQSSVGYEGDFSIEESMYSINVPGRIDPITNRIMLPTNLPNPGYKPS